eukprot:1176018-Prorocentrum_minimum.AAC.1
MAPSHEKTLYMLPISIIGYRNFSQHNHAPRPPPWLPFLLSTPRPTRLLLGVVYRGSRVLRLTYPDLRPQAVGPGPIGTLDGVLLLKSGKVRRRHQPLHVAPDLRVVGRVDVAGRVQSPADGAA